MFSTTSKSAACESKRGQGNKVHQMDTLTIELVRRSQHNMHQEEATLESGDRKFETYLTTYASPLAAQGARSANPGISVM